MRIFEYEGHTVSIRLEVLKGKERHWWYIDGVPIQFASNQDTATRLATRFIDVLTDDHYGTSRNASNYKIQ